MEHNEELQVTLGSVVREVRNVGRIVEMPSGYFFRLRPTSFDLLVKQGRVPDGLVALAAGTIMGEERESDHDATLSEISEQVDFYNMVVTLAMVEPRVVDDPQKDDEIHVDDIEFGDKLFISRLLFQPLRELETFRHEQEGDVVAVRPDEDDLATGEPDDALESVGF